MVFILFEKFLHYYDYYSAYYKYHLKKYKLNSEPVK